MTLPEVLEELKDAFHELPTDDAPPDAVEMIETALYTLALACAMLWPEVYRE